MQNLKHFWVGILGVITVEASAELIPIDVLNMSDKKNQTAQITKDALAPENQKTKSEATKVTDDMSVTDRLSALATSTIKNFTQNGMASWYGRQFHGSKTANGEIFNMNAFTAAHKSLPLNCFIKVTNKANGKSVVVRVNDRGPFHGNRVIDLSYGAAKVLGIVDSGTANVSIERIN